MRHEGIGVVGARGSVLDEFLIEPEAIHDRDSLQSERIEAGFDAVLLGKAFDWLAKLQAEPPTASTPVRSRLVCIFAAKEREVFDSVCRGFLQALERQGVLDAEARERVIERALALEQSPVDRNDLKWAVQRVRYRAPDGEVGYAGMASELLGPARTRSRLSNDSWSHSV